MKVAICSLPGSDAYLISNFLIELSFNDSNYYLIDNESFYYGSVSSSNDINDLKTCKKSNYTFDEIVGKINDNEILSGHFGIDKKRYLDSFKTIFLYRDIKYSLVSFAFLVEKLMIWNSDKVKSDRIDINKKEFAFNFLKIHTTTLYYLFTKIIPWKSEEEVLVINFEKLYGELGREIQIEEFKKIVKYLHYDLSDREIELKIANALNKDNLFKNNNKNDCSFFFTKDFLNFYKKNGFKRLNKSLGFEKIKEILKNKFSLSENLSFYDRYWKQNKKKVATWNYGINIVDNLISNYDFKTILDAGCGSGDVVRYLTSKGYDTKGIELSGSVLKDFAGDMLKKGIVQQGSLMKLPFKDNEFDVVFSSEVLEHIDEDDIPKVVEELSRVCKEIIFLTISLRPSSNFNKYHINLKPREWWENQFLQHSFTKEKKIIDKLQMVKPNATVGEIMEIGPTKTHIHEMEWFINKPPYDLHGELEPWYFIFKKKCPIKY